MLYCSLKKERLNMRRLKRISGEFLVVIGTLLVAMAFFLVFTWGDSAVTMTYITVTEKIDNSQGGKYDFRVVTEGGEEFVVRNVESQGIFTATKVFRTLEEGKSYQVLVTGRRLPLFGLKRNIVQAVPVQ
jgi:hypothetical protein